MHTWILLLALVRLLRLQEAILKGLEFQELSAKGFGSLRI